MRSAQLSSVTWRIRSGQLNNLIQDSQSESLKAGKIHKFLTLDSDDDEKITHEEFKTFFQKKVNELLTECFHKKQIQNFQAIFLPITTKVFFKSQMKSAAQHFLQITLLVGWISAQL